MNQKLRLAAIINAVLSLLGLVLSIVGLIQHSASPNSQPPFGALLIGIVFGLAGLASSYGIWKGLRWGVILTVVIRAIDGVLSIPGLIFADSTWLFIWALVSVIGAVAVILLIILARPKTAT